MKLNEVMADVSSQLEQQSENGVQITTRNEIPEVGPVNRGLWFQIPRVTAVFADLKGSTGLNADDGPEVAAYAYTYFIRAMTVTLERFSAGYIDIQGDGIFGLFSGRGSRFYAAACAVTMRTLVEREVSVRFEQDSSSDWKLEARIGIDHGTLLVRRLGLRGTKQNEVWAGNPVNMAAKLSGQAGPNQIMVSERVFRQYENSSQLRQRALLWSCGCKGGSVGGGLDIPIRQTTCLWEELPAPDDEGLNFSSMHKLESAWCKTHGPEFCETIITGKRPDR